MAEITDLSGRKFDRNILMQQVGLAVIVLQRADKLTVDDAKQKVLEMLKRLIFGTKIFNMGGK